MTRSGVEAERVTWRFLFTNKRATVYLVWMIIVPPGFFHLYFEQPLWINLPWLVGCIVGFSYMAYVMRPFEGKLSLIFSAWFVPISFGMAISFLAASGDQFYWLLPHLALVWALAQTVGYTLNGLVDPPSRWYWVAASLHFLAAMFILFFPVAIPLQWLILAILSFVSLSCLWLFRSSYP